MDLARAAPWVAPLVFVLSSSPGARGEESFPTRMDRAIAAGAEHLEANVRKRGWLDQGTLSPQYPMGTVALTVTALCRAGVPAKGPTVEQGLAILRRLAQGPGAKPPKIPGWPKGDWTPRTYDLAMGILALEAPHVRRRVTVVGDQYLIRYSRGKIPARDRACMDQLARGLIAFGKDGAWGYDGSTPNPDNSNTQYAVLALNVARRCGVRVPTHVWRAVVGRLLRDQQKDGPELELAVLREKRRSVGKKRPAGPARTKTKKRQSQALETLRVRARTWGYYMNAGDPRYSMSMACLSSLVMARESLRAAGALGAGLERRIAGSLRSGLAYVAMHWDRKYLAADPYGELVSLPYDLYSFEKMGELDHLATINGHDWYREGAEKLLSAQRGSDWGPFQNTAMALLFLNRATLSDRVQAREIAVVTGEGQQRDDDLVTIKATGGLVSGREALQIYAETPSRFNAKCAKQVIAAYPEHRLPRLIPELLELHELGGKQRKVAKRAFKKLTGSSKVDVDAMYTLHARWSPLYALERMTEEVDLDPVRAELSVDSPEIVADQALRVVAAHRSSGAETEVFDLFAHDSARVRERARTVLWRLTGIDQPFDADGSKRVRSEQIEAWRQALAERSSK